MMLILRKQNRKLETTEVYDTYWQFAFERQEIFFRRIERREGPWSDDEIFKRFKFTNAYRASDRVSQYLIKNVIYSGDWSFEERFFRIVLFKLFNKIETWEALQRTFGEVSLENFEQSKYSDALKMMRSQNRSIFSGAYIMPSGKSAFHHSQKHQNCLSLLELMLKSSLPQRLLDSSNMKDAFELLLSFPMIGPFLAYQLVTDLNYSPELSFSEMDFVMPGPGALSGIRKCFKGSLSHDGADIIRAVTERQADEFERRGLHFRTLWGRPLQLIDCQNLFCEVDKYARVAHPQFKGFGQKSRIKQRFRPNKEQIQYWFPPKWELNDKMGDL